MKADGSAQKRLTRQGGADEEQPAWSPNGKSLAYISEQDGARELYVADVAAPQTRWRVTALENHQWPGWTPDGGALIYVAQAEDGQWLEQIRIGQAPMRLTGNSIWIRQPDWSARASVDGDPASLERGDDPLYVEKTTPNPPDRPDRFNLVKLNNVRVIVPLISDAVDDSYNAARQRILDESGWDFLGQLSEAVRPLSFKSEASDFLSWHKAGRAIDTLQAYSTTQGQMLEVAREDVRGNTYWRLYLRAAKQDGSQGEPLRQYLWDVSDVARSRSRGRGGLVKGMPAGYYVDLTELLRQYGWQRISAHTDPDFDWHTNYTALEFWHYQKTDGLSWWDAIREVYTPPDLGDQFTYARLVKAKYDISTIIEKGIPVPIDVLQKYSMLEP
jgi:TolB protein